MENESTALNATGRRPVVITVFCILGMGIMLLSLLAAPQMVKLLKESIGPWYVPIWIASVVITIVSLIGYWLMRRWGVYLYTATFIAGTVFGLIFGIPFSVPGLLVPFVVIALGFSYFRRMT